MKKPVLGDIVAVHWVDQSYYHGPTEPKNAIEEAHGVSLGHFIEENKDWICIGAEHFRTCGNPEPGQYRQIMSFPKVCVSKVVIFKRGSKF